MSDSLRYYGLWPARLLCLWDFPGKTTRVGHQTIIPVLSNETSAQRDPAAGVSALEGSPVPSYLRLDGVQPSHLHLQQPVLPVEAGHAEIVNASRDVAEGLAILEEAVTVVVDLECSLGGILQSKDWTP